MSPHCFERQMRQTESQSARQNCGSMQRLRVDASARLEAALAAANHVDGEDACGGGIHARLHANVWQGQRCALGQARRVSQGAREREPRGRAQPARSRARSQAVPTALSANRLARPKIGEGASCACGARRSELGEGSGATT